MQSVVTSIGQYRQILGPDSLGLPGLALLGRNLTGRAANPLQLHRHAGLMEFVVLVRGNECYVVDGQAYHLSGGDVFFTQSDQEHGNGSGIQGVCEIIWFQIDPLAKDLLGLSRERAADLSAHLLRLPPHRLQIDREGLALLQKSFKTYLRLDPGMYDYAGSLFVGFIRRLLMNQSRQPVDQPIRLALQIIEASLTTKLSLAELSQACGLSLSSLKHKFRERTGKTPRDSINQQKIAKAAAMLRQGCSVIDCAMAFGFCTSAYFTVVFRKYMNETPTRYQARLAVNNRQSDGQIK